MANPIEAKIWSTFGGIPTSMPTSEVYSALQAGAIDGGENSPSVIESFKYNEPAPHVALTEHQYSIAPLIMSEKRFNALNPELQKVFMEVIRETCQYQRKRDAELVAESLERMKVKGTKITQPDKAKFAALATPIQEEVAKNLKVEDLLAPPGFFVPLRSVHAETAELPENALSGRQREPIRPCLRALAL